MQEVVALALRELLSWTQNLHVASFVRPLQDVADNSGSGSGGSCGCGRGHGALRCRRGGAIQTYVLVKSWARNELTYWVNILILLAPPHISAAFPVQGMLQPSVAGAPGASMMLSQSIGYDKWDIRFC